MTGQEILAVAREGRPNVRYALHRKGHAVAAWSEEQQRWIAVACLAINDQWVSMPFELLVNGAPVYQNGDWTE